MRTKLEAGNFVPFDERITGTDMTLYDFDTRTGPTGNDIVMGSLVYRFPIGDRAEVFIDPQGLGSPDIAPQLSPVAGAVSRFGQRNPIYRLSDGTGVGVNIRFTEAITGSLTYLGSTNNFSNPDVGLFDGQFGALAQLTFSPGNQFGIAFTYVRYYSPEPGEGINLTGNTGKGNALGWLFGMPPRVRGNDVVSRRDLDTSYRAEAFFRYKLTDNIAITPGAFVVFNPEHNDANDTIVVGTLLTTFSF